MAPTSATVTYKAKGEVADEKFVIAHGDGLRYIGQSDRIRCPHVRTRTMFSRDGAPHPETKEQTATTILVGPPPDGSTDADLLDAGIGGCATLETAALLTPSGQWLHVPRAEMSDAMDLVSAAREDREAEAAAEKPPK